MKSLMLACASLCLATTAGASTPQTTLLALSVRPDTAPRLGEAYLGMSLADWKALPRSPALSPRASPSCSGGTGSGSVVCSYLARYGAVTLTQSLPLTARYLARDPHYSFTKGRLSAIRFLTSVDAFSALTAQFTQAYGAPKQIIRDTLSRDSAVPLPRVREVWRKGDQSVRMTDPAARPDRLEVDLTNPTATRESGSAAPPPGAL